MKLYTVPANADAIALNVSNGQRKAIKTKKEHEFTQTIIDPVSYANHRVLDSERMGAHPSTISWIMDSANNGNYVFPDMEHKTSWVLVVQEEYVKIV